MKPPPAAERPAAAGRKVALALLVSLAALRLAAADPPPSWQPVPWHGEPALASVSAGMKAIVSLARDRLVSFGPADAGAPNLLFATASRDDPGGWGGHRAWLGPQLEWPAPWPPPAAWEKSGPESYASDAGVLRLRLADAGGGWPRLTRTYAWDGPRLRCSIEAHGGTHPAQVIQIIQVPADRVIAVLAAPEPGAGQGCVLLRGGDNPKLRTGFPVPPQLHRAGDRVELRHTDTIAKLGFRPQPLAASGGGYTLVVSRDPDADGAVEAPDLGFFTQVYLGGREPFIELEQLSPRYAAGTDFTATIILEVRAP